MKTKLNLLKQAFLLALLASMAFNSPNLKAVTPVKHAGSWTSKPDSKRYTYNELRSGDCVMAAGGTLDLFSDGHAEFRATVWTNHTTSGDTWHHRVFFKDAGGQVIFQITLEGPNHMNDDGTHYAFSSDFNFPAGIYYAVATIEVSGSC